MSDRMHAVMVDATLLPHTGELRYPVLPLTDATTVHQIKRWAQTIDPAAEAFSITLTLEASDE